MTGIPGAIENLNYIGIFLLLVLGGAGLPFPEDLILMFCGYLIASEGFRPVYTVIAAYKVSTPHSSFFDSLHLDLFEQPERNFEFFSNLLTQISVCILTMALNY